MVIPDRGQVIDGGRGTAEELQLTDAEAERAFSVASGLTVGVVTPGPGADAADLDVAEIVDALRSTVERHGGRVATCERRGCTAAADRPASSGSWRRTRSPWCSSAASATWSTRTTQALRSERLIVVGIGDSRLAPLSVVIDSDPLTRAFEQGRAGGTPPGVPRSKKKGRRSWRPMRAPVSSDPGADAVILGLRNRTQGAGGGHARPPRARRQPADLKEAVAQLSPTGILIGEGVRLTQATAEGLDALPADLRVVAIACTSSLMSLIDLGSRIRGCIAKANDGAGEAAGNAVLGLLTGRDVPAFVDAPLYAYRGTVPVGPGRVQLGRRLPGSHLGRHRRGAGSRRRAPRRAHRGHRRCERGRRKEPEAAGGRREAIEAELGELGATSHALRLRQEPRAAGCCTWTSSPAAPLPSWCSAAGWTSSDRPAEAIAAGVPVVGVDADYLGDTGAVYVDVDDRAVGRLQGRMAAPTRPAPGPRRPPTRPSSTTGAAGADAGSRTRSSAPPASPTPTCWSSAAGRPARRTPGRRHRARKYRTCGCCWVPVVRGMADLKVRQEAKAARTSPGSRWPARRRTPIDAGGRLKGCVDVDLPGRGARSWTRSPGSSPGGTLPGLIDVPLSPYGRGPAASGRRRPRLDRAPRPLARAGHRRPDAWVKGPMVGTPLGSFRFRTGRRMLSTTRRPTASTHLGSTAL